MKSILLTTASNRRSYEFLFFGGSGTGKTTTARILAMCLNCPNLMAMVSLARAVVSHWDVIEVDGAVIQPAKGGK